MPVDKLSMDKHFAAIWKSIAKLIEDKVGPDSFHRWFAAIELTKADDEQLVLRVPNNIYQYWIESNYLPFLNAAIIGVLGSPRAVKFQFPSAGSELAETNADSPAQAPKPPVC